MKSLMIKRALIAAIIILSGIAGYPHKSDDVGKTVKEIVKKYEDSTGVKCMTIVKGEGLELVKM